MGAKLSRKKSEAGIGAETTGPAVEEPATADGSPVTENAEQKFSESDGTEESKPSEQAEAASSTSVLQTITQAVEETVSAVTEQIAAPVEDVVSKGIEAVESALASVSLIGKETAAPEQEPEPVVDLATSDVLQPQEPSLLDDLLKSPISEALVSGVTVVSEAITNETVEDKMTNPAPAENKDLLQCLDKVETPSLDLLDCKPNHESTIPNSDPPFTLEEMGQNVVDTVNLI